MSSDLRDLLRTDLDQIPLPPDDQWTMRRARHGRSLGVAVVAILIALVVAASLGGGQALQALRERIESDRAAGGVFIAGDDYVYASDGGPSVFDGTPTQAVQAIAMPAGQSVGRFIGNTYVGTTHDGGLMTFPGDRAYLPVATSTGRRDEYEIGLQEIDLSRGLALRRIPLGIDFLDGSLQAELPGTPLFPAAAAVSADGSSIWVVRDRFDHGQATFVERLDGQTLSPLAQTVLLTSTDAGAVRSRVVVLGADRVAIVREHYESRILVAADWYFLDPQLGVIASYAGDSRLPAGGKCSTDVRPNPANTGWLVLCSDSSLSGDGALVFLEASTLTISATVSLPRERGFALGMAAAADGTVYVLSDRPVVTRIDPRTRRTIDARAVIQARSWLDQLLPQAAAAKSPGGPTVVFSPDGRYAYLAGPPDQWWGSIATVDMRDAKVIAHTDAFGGIAAVGLSPGGERLYVLATDREGNRRIVLLAPNTLQYVGQSATIANDPFGILTVRRQVPGGS